MSQNAKILIVEDEPAIRIGLIDVFIYHGYEVDFAENGDVGLDKALSGEFDLILLDVMLPGVDGFEICNCVRAQSREQAIIMLTAKSSDEDIIKGLSLGADDYVAKPFSVAQLVLRVQAVLRRTANDIPKNQTITLDIDTVIDCLNMSGKSGDKSFTFTRREIDLLQYLEANSHRPVSRDELLHKVWGYADDLDLETRTVDIHIAKLRLLMDKKRLRLWLLLFFLALLLPAALLIQQSYSRLKWETFHQYQKMASELSQRIDARIIRLVSDENKRPVTDYTFLDRSDKNTRLIQRSPLSNFPVESDIPGVLGYFQVDSKGKLTSPLVPPTDGNYIADSLEFNQRLAVRDQLQQVLVTNKLVKGTPLAEVTIEAESIMSDSADMPDNGMSAMANAQASSPTQPTLAFEQLKERSKQVASKNNYERLEDIVLKQNYQQKSDQLNQQRMVKQEKRQAYQKASIAKSSQFSTVDEQASTNLGLASPAQQGSLRIRTFEGDIEPFQFSQLDSGHFVLFRKVWLNGQRFTQGLLIEQTGFLSLIRDAFLSTSLSEMSNAFIAYHGNVVTSIYSKNESKIYPIKSKAMTGEELYQVRLSDPFSDLQIIYSITDLPVGPGGRLILWLSLIIASVLLGGFYLMYRLGIKQINLANQQQDFVSAVSHELKTPLTSIRMYGEILKEGWAPEEKKRSYYDFIYDESERLSRLINNVLQLARLNRNEQQPELSSCSVNELVHEIESKVASQLEMASFKLTVDTEDGIKDTSVSVDRDWLMQVMINLVDNAIKFSAKSERKEVVLGVNRDANNAIQFTVSDFGPGIDKQQMQAIFELFYRSENELTRDTVGTGIGLSLVHQMVTNMGGKVAVKNREYSLQSKDQPSAKFSGAIFSLSFPIIPVP